MPAPRDMDKELSGKLITSGNDWLKFLPAPIAQENNDYKEIPVDIETWLYSPSYMNLGTMRLSQIQVEPLYILDDINPSTNTITEVVLEWGKGSGKDLIAALMALRQSYQLLCLRNVYSYYGMAPNSGIELCNVAYTKAQAKEVYFKTLKGLLEGSRWFKKHSINVKAESIHFPYNITMLSKAADGDSAEGQNMFFAVMDEASAFKDSNAVRAMNKAEGEKVKSSAEGIYDVLRSSSRSRFPTVGKVVIMSYPRYINDFTQTKRKENENNPNGWTSGPHPTWVVNPLRKQSDFQADYDKNPEMADAMYACKPPFAEDGYIKHPNRMITAIARGREIGLENPMDAAGVCSPDFEGSPGRFYAIHVDLALNRDTCAMALACQGQPVRRMKCSCNAFNLKDVLRCAQCHRPFEEWPEMLLPTIVFPLIRTFDKKGEKMEVNFAEVREEIMWIRERGHYIWALSYDGWQSQDSVQTMSQILGKRKVKKSKYGGPKDFSEEEIVQILSVDRSTGPHDTLKEFIYDERAFIMPGSNEDVKDETNQDITARAYREWKRLRNINGRKIDHPAGGSKDIVDAMAGAAWWVSKMPISRVRMPQVSGWSESR